MALSVFGVIVDCGLAVEPLFIIARKAAVPGDEGKGPPTRGVRLGVRPVRGVSPVLGVKPVRNALGSKAM